MYFFFVNGSPFIHTKYDLINFLSLHMCKGRGNKEVPQGLYVILELYESRVFEILHIRYNDF